MIQHCGFITVGNRRFSKTRIDGTIQIISVNPYDETDYHWARRTPGSTRWQIIRAGKTYDWAIGENGAALTTEEVCKLLDQMDKAANLHRTGGIW